MVANIAQYQASVQHECQHSENLPELGHEGDQAELDLPLIYVDDPKDASQLHKWSKS